MAISSHAPGAGIGPSEPGSARSPRRATRRRRRWLVLALALVVGSFAAVAGGACYVASHLDAPWVKTRVLAAVHDAAGFDVDYEGVELSLSGELRAHSLRLLSPPRFAAAAEDFARVDELLVQVRPWRLLLGQLEIDALRVGGISVKVVRDASGATSLSELFPEEEAAPPSESPSPLSHTLSELPSVRVREIQLARIGARYIELVADGTARVSSLAGSSAAGALHSGSDGLTGTELSLTGNPLVLELSTPGGVRHAQLGLELGARAVEARAIALRGRVALREQDVVPSWISKAAQAAQELLALDATLRFDEDAGKTGLSIAPLRVFGTTLALDAQADVFDGEPSKIVASGNANLSLSELPPLPAPVESVKLQGLELALHAKELAWDGTRIGGNVEYDGRLGRVELGEPEASVRLQTATLRGEGSFGQEAGQFTARLGARNVWSQSGSQTLEIDGLTLDSNGRARAVSGAQQIEVAATLALGGVHLGAAGQQLALVDVNLVSRARATAAELAAGSLPALDATLTIAAASAADGVSRTLLQSLSATAAARGLAADAAAELGLRGDADVTLTVPTVRVLDGTGRGGRREHASLSARGATLHAAVPLSLETLTGSVSLAALDAGSASLGDLALDFELAHPLAWGAGRAEVPRALLRGRLGAVEAAGSGGSLEGLRLLAEQPSAGRYHVELDATGASLELDGRALPGKVSAELRADAEPDAGTLTLSTDVRGERGAALDLDIDGRFDRATERLRYHAGLSAQKLGAFAAVVSDVEPRAAALRLEGARLSAQARGDFAGVLRAGEGGAPELREHPLASARGTQSAQLALEGLDYRSNARTLVVPKLELELESSHRDDGAGDARARLAMKSLRLEGGGTSVRLQDVDQKLVATFDRSPDHGMMNIHSSLELGAAAQSFLPEYPVRGLSFTSDVQIDRLRSIYLRELAIDNPASGSSLRAKGTLELLAKAGPGGEQTLVGREALSFEGQLEQKLGSLQALGAASHASGTLSVPFRLESGGLLGYRLLAALQAKQVSFVKKDGAFSVQNLNGVVPLIEEFAVLESGVVVSAGPRTSPLSDTRFFDVHPFLSGNDYVTADSLGIGGIEPLGPVAANVRVERSDFVVDQLQAGYRGGQIVGQVRAAYRDGDPIVRFRLNATGLRSGRSQKVFDANAALSFVPGAMTLDGKVQIVRASREHLEDIMDVLDPFHESANANRVRQALALGYPKFVRFQLHDGAVDTKVELGGIAQLVRIDEIRAVPLGPILQKYVAPTLSRFWNPHATAPAADASAEPLEASGEAAPDSAPRAER